MNNGARRDNRDSHRMAQDPFSAVPSGLETERLCQDSTQDYHPGLRLTKTCPN